MALNLDPHPENELYVCDFCEQDFQGKEDLMSHALEHKEQLFSCSYCFKKFSTEFDLIKHSVVHTNETNLFDIVLREDIIKDNCTSANQSLYKCDLCEAEFQFKTHFLKHRKTHSGQLLHCEYCEKTFAFKSAYQIHIRLHTGKFPYKCNYCSRSFNYKSNLQTHEKLHLNYRPYVCEYCNKGYVQKALFINHVRSKHTNERPFRCEYCNKCFATKSNLKNHLKSHFCKVCDEYFADRKFYNNHMKMHADRKDFHCTQCSTTFQDIDTFSYHIRNHTKRVNFNHNIEMSFFCEQCDLKFPDIDCLTSHLKIHAKRENTKKKKWEKIFLCHICGQINCEGHKEIILSKTHLYNCKYCDMHFQEEVDLLIHTAIHKATFEISDDHVNNSNYDENLIMNYGEQIDVITTDLPDNSNKDDIYRCEICGEECDNYENFKTHVAVHSIYAEYEVVNDDECGDDINEIVQKYSTEIKMETDSDINQQIDLDSNLSIRIENECIRKCSLCLELFTGSVDFAVHFLKMHSNTVQDEESKPNVVELYETEQATNNTNSKSSSKVIENTGGKNEKFEKNFVLPSDGQNEETYILISDIES